MGGQAVLREAVPVGGLPAALLHAAGNMAVTHGLQLQPITQAGFLLVLRLAFLQGGKVAVFLETLIFKLFGQGLALLLLAGSAVLDEGGEATGKAVVALVEFLRGGALARVDGADVIGVPLDGFVAVGGEGVQLAPAELS